MNNTLTFSKMQGLGNDFMVLDTINQTQDWPALLTPERIAQWADRHFGVGFDQLLLVEPPSDPAFDFRYRIFNADGGEVQQCGNGARCFARYVRAQGLTDKHRIQVETQGGPLVLTVTADEQVCVDMGPPRFDPASMGFDPNAAIHLGGQRYRLEDSEHQVDVAIVSMGNPHAVIMVEQLADYPVAEVGAWVQAHPAFTQGVNVGFAEIEHPDRLALRVYERGAGETLACGTGACAAAVCTQRDQGQQNPTEVVLRGGPLNIDWPGDDQSVQMTGPATFVFHGQIPL